jgi:hypothetical protein
MKLITSKRPSAAMIVALLALSLGLGGSAVAGSGVLTKNQVKTVANKQITKRAPRLAVARAKSADIAKSADTAKSADNAKSADTARSADNAKSADTARSADTAGRATNVHAANVNSDGSLLGSVPAGVTSERSNTGVYLVTFTRPIAGCLISAALGGNDGNAPLGGAANTIPYTQGNPNQLVVITYNGAGAYEDRDFYVQMVCP